MRTAPWARYRRSAFAAGVCAFLIASTAPPASSSPSETANSAAAAAPAATGAPSPPIVPPVPEAISKTPPAKAPEPPPAKAPEPVHSSPESAASPPPHVPAPDHPSAPAVAIPGAGQQSAQESVESVRIEGSSNLAPVANSKRSLTPPSATATAGGRQEQPHGGQLAKHQHSIAQAEVPSLGRWISRVWPAVAVLFPGRDGETAAVRENRLSLVLAMAHVLSVPTTLLHAIGNSMAVSAAESPSSGDSTTSLAGRYLTPSPEVGFLILIAVSVTLLSLFMIAGLNGRLSPPHRS